MPMQPRPTAETSRALCPLPNVLFCNASPPVLTRHTGTYRGRSFWREFAEPVRGGNSAVHEEVAASDERAVLAHKERADGADFVRGAGAPGRAQIHHSPVPFAARPGQFVLGQRCDDDSGADRV